MNGLKSLTEKNYFEEKLKEFADHAIRNSFKLFRLNERDRCDVEKQSRRSQCVFNEFCENQDKNEHENEQNKKILWIKRKEFDENDVVNNINEVIYFNEKRDALWMRWWNEKIEL